MAFTDAQRLIIKEICLKEISTLGDIIINSDLGESESGVSWLEILEMHGCNRSDFDEQLILTHKQFQNLHKDPEFLFEMDETDRRIFRGLLKVYQYEFEDHYPVALKNLWVKLSIWESLQETSN